MYAYLARTYLALANREFTAHGATPRWTWLEIESARCTYLAARGTK